MHINKANIRKTLYYFKRNGLRATWYAVKERLEDPVIVPYCYEQPTEEELTRQKNTEISYGGKISIVVPAYRTKELYLRDLVESLLAQTYSHWELILADATEDNRVSEVIQCYGDERIRYVRLPGNNGISENTNQAILHATGDYVGLLDHDDVLTPDALYEMAVCIGQALERGEAPDFVYSDEDKCDGDRSRYYELHRKEDFNFDLLLSNNYICHFLVMKGTLLKELGFRKEYDGAQDYDLVLRAVSARRERVDNDPELAKYFLHVPKVLYHWRCHENSTAENPQSKEYAYVAGKRALQDFVQAQGWKAQVTDLRHKGYYRVNYEEPFFASRKKVGAVGGRILSGRKIASGRLSDDGNVYYEGTPANYSGYMHAAVLQQDAEAVDIRCVRLNETCLELFENTIGVPYSTKAETGFFDVDVLPDNADINALSVALGRALREAGYLILWDPSISA